jgi:hypothetical protein
MIYEIGSFSIFILWRSSITEIWFISCIAIEIYWIAASERACCLFDVCAVQSLTVYKKTDFSFAYVLQWDVVLLGHWIGDTLALKPELLRSNFLQNIIKQLIYIPFNFLLNK